MRMLSIPNRFTTSASTSDTSVHSHYTVGDGGSHEKQLTLEGTRDVGFSYVVVSGGQWLARAWGVEDLPLGVGTEVMADYRHWGPRGKIGLAKYVCHVLVLLRVEILQQKR